ncbi:hypothetical protein K437DRAFT_227679 [Tilletiaria anomala UBC 951]|uniref:Uncharacterized protein n=1 Tax=Tilletiaria anomala (strain ATCC 24038 / CBS 436.72 / UBC 951) TaxID=1037660 RepID=A0A066VMD6_TILAU|nr:uncharacterized protein K437DRAFT_227679 [Tilletiaria anomala UBC 951]KDN39914.1 hypothetical protein K437DRAFT_227679 [Tilletiaria anomala UBC 951]
MPSMDPKCTPLKHRYDQCFNLWFDEYLDLAAPAATAPPAASRRAELRKKYDSCAALFEDYKTCVRAAVRERDLEPLIAEARCFNPFPFPSGDNKASGGAQSSSNNHPFPFPASENESGNV